MSTPGGPQRVAFQGERGAFSEEAAVKLLGEGVTLVPRPTFESLFAATAEGAADLALAPVENTLAGSVHRVYDLLLDSPLHMTAEVVIPIRHFLIGPPGATAEGVEPGISGYNNLEVMAICQMLVLSASEGRRVLRSELETPARPVS